MLEDEKFQLGAWVNIHTHTRAGMGWGLEISFFMILKRCDASKGGRHKFSSLAHKNWLRRPFCGRKQPIDA